MAETGRLTLPVARALPLSPVTALRIAIIVAVVVVWEAVSASGLLYRDVVPSLLAIGKALAVTLREPSFYFHLGTTAYEIGIAMLIGGLGQLINELAERYDLPATYASIFFVILVSVCVFVIMERLERWLRPVD